MVSQPESRKLRYVGTDKDRKNPVEGTSIVMQAMAFDTPAVCRLIADAQRLWPNEGENCSSDFIVAVSHLHGEIHISEVDWGQTGEPMPKCRRDIERLLGLIGREDLARRAAMPVRITGTSRPTASAPTAATTVTWPALRESGSRLDGRCARGRA